MRLFNYKETIDLDYNIDKLLLINFEKNINNIFDNDTLKITGVINISGKITSNNSSYNFFHPLNIEIYLDKDKISSDKIDLDIDDFSYVLNENKIILELNLKLEGLKEIDETFLSNESDEPIKEIINENIDEEIRESINLNMNIKDIVTRKEIKTNKSLLSKLFNKRSNSISCYFFHVVKENQTYKDIALLYNIDENIIKSINNNELLYIGKLIAIPNKL